MLIAPPKTILSPVFGSLNAGDVFLIDGFYYIKIVLTCVKINNRNAVNLNTGDISYISDDTAVVRYPNATVLLGEPG